MSDDVSALLRELECVLYQLALTIVVQDLVSVDELSVLLQQVDTR